MTDVGTVVDVGGRIASVRSHGALCFWDLTWGGATIQVVGDGATQLRRLDLVVLRGSVTRTGDRIELHLLEVVRHRAPQDRGRADLLPLVDPARGAALRTRAALERAARAELEDGGFLPVRSPSIVGDWVEGQTGAFGLGYYGRAAYLTISNMLCHQILLGEGLRRIYEIGPLFRAERPSGRRRLAEFTILDIGMAFAGIEELVDVVEATVGAICGALAEERPDVDIPLVTRPFTRIGHAHLLAEVGLSATSGSQLPAAARRYLADRFPGFVWVVGFPSETRPFFVRAVDGTCVDAQLWYRGKLYLAAGGERETVPDEVLRRIQAEGKDASRYDFFLDYLRAGLPPSVGIGMGIERFLGAVVGGDAVDYAAFPGLVGRVGPRVADVGRA